VDSNSKVIDVKDNVHAFSNQNLNSLYPTWNISKKTKSTFIIF